MREKAVYDENGNILSYIRHGNTTVGPLAMDSLTFHYNTNTNQLREVNDAVTATNYTVDIDNETSKHNYRYNGVGELASDSIAGIDSIYWTVYNKVKKIVKTNNDSIVFMYDPIGNRLEERNFPHGGTSDTMKYTRDAQGNVMVIYDRKKDTVRLSEFDIYGATKLGSLDTVLRMQKFITGHGTLDSLTIPYLERQKQYELTNHSGNVMVTVSDGKTPFDTNAATPGIADYYLPIVINAQDYYPFGMVQPGRSYTLSNDSSYKYGYQGSMKDNNIYGINNAYTTLNRELDDRLSRWWSTDPVDHPDQSPYLTMGDNPILNNDILGNIFGKYGETHGDKDHPNNDEQQANKLRDVYSTRQKTYQKQANDLKEQIKDFKGDKNSSAYFDLLDAQKEAQDGADEMQHAQDELTALANDKNYYTFDPQSNSNVSRSGPANDPNPDGTFTYKIQYSSHSEYGTKAHETKHAFDWMMALTNKSNPNDYYVKLLHNKLGREIEPYKRQFFVDPSSLPAVESGFNKIGQLMIPFTPGYSEQINEHYVNDIVDPPYDNLIHIPEPARTYIYR